MADDAAGAADTTSMTDSASTKNDADSTGMTNARGATTAHGDAWRGNGGTTRGQAWTLEKLRRERQDMLVLARRMLRPATCTAPLEDPATSGEAALEEAVALCLDAYARGSSCVRLSEVGDLDWPVAIDTDALVRALEASPQVCRCGRLSAAAGEGADMRVDAPLNLDGDLLYLTRCARMEARIAQEVLDRSGMGASEANWDAGALEQVASDLMGIYGSEGRRIGLLSAQQARAIAVAATHRLTVLTGGPGTGKTTVVVRIMAALDALACHYGTPGAPGTSSLRPLEFRLAAPTGKAAARLRESVTSGIESLRELSEGTRMRLLRAGEGASTLHSLLGADRSPLERFRHDEDNPLEGDVFIVDEVSMVSLSLLDALLRAVPRGARVILVGDPDQLASVDAGTVLSDLVRGLCSRSRALDDEASHHAAVDKTVRDAWVAAGGKAADWQDDLAREGSTGLVQLNEGHRSTGGVALLTQDIQRLSAGDGDAGQIAARTQTGDYEGVSCVTRLAGSDAYDDLTNHYREMEALALDGRPEEALRCLGEMVLLCASRGGSLGSRAWNERMARDLAERGAGRLDALGERVGCPIMVTRNDHALGLSNGDVGVLVCEDGMHKVCFEDPGGVDGVRRVARAEIAHAETAYAITIHKSQGSEYDRVIVQLADDASSPLNVRELVYTGISRAKREVTIVGRSGSESLENVGATDALARALASPIRRASGLAERIGAESTPL